MRLWGIDTATGRAPGAQLQHRHSFHLLHPLQCQRQRRQLCRRRSSRQWLPLLLLQSQSRCKRTSSRSNRLGMYVWATLANLQQQQPPQQQQWVVAELWPTANSKQQAAAASTPLAAPRGACRGARASILLAPALSQQQL
jgi:hypothetical protein